MLINTDHVLYVEKKDEMISIFTKNATIDFTDLKDIDKTYDDLTHDIKTKHWVELDDYDTPEEDVESTKTL